MYARTLAFLGLNDWQPERFAAHNTNSYPPLPAALNDELAAFFQTGSSRLAEMLGEEFTWPQPQVAQDVK